MPLLTTLAALVMIVHCVEEDLDTDYRHDLRPRVLDTGTSNYEQVWQFYFQYYVDYDDKDSIFYYLSLFSDFSESKTVLVHSPMYYLSPLSPESQIKQIKIDMISFYWQTYDRFRKKNLSFTKIHIYI